MQRTPIIRSQLQQNRHRAFTLFEFVIVLVVAVILGYYLYQSMFVARQRAVVGKLSEGGARSKINDEEGTVRMLDLSSMPQSKISMKEIAMLADLKSLNLDHTETTDEQIRFLTENITLQQLHLVGTSITDVAGQLFGKWRLQLLDVRATILTDMSMPTIAALERLVVLSLAQTCITNDGIKHLRGHKTLAVLDLRFTNFDDDGIQHLLSLKSLKRVRLTGSRVSDEGILKLRKARPKLAIGWEPNPQSWHHYRIILTGTPAKPAVAQEAEDQPARSNFERPVVERIKAAGGRVQFIGPYVWEITLQGLPEQTDEVLQDIHKLRNLQRINVHDMPKFTGESLDCLKNCWRLNHVSIIDSGLTDKGLHQFGRARSLRQIQIDGSQVTDAGMTAFQDGRALQWIIAKRCNITAKGLEAFARTSSPYYFYYMDVRDTSIRADDIRELRKKFPRLRVEFSKK